MDEDAGQKDSAMDESGAELKQQSLDLIRHRYEKSQSKELFDQMEKAFNESPLKGVTRRAAVLVLLFSRPSSCRLRLKC